MTPIIEKMPLENKKIHGKMISPVKKMEVDQKTMKALVYGGPGIIELKEVTVPVIIEPTDVLVKIIKSTICGTDLGISHGKIPSVKPGTTLG
ncbi:MAG: alcohol dehydrogenase catalytic domain-containing protein, partial [Chitinophagaceae bacterium]